MKILITGGTGMLGSAFNKIQTKHEIVFLNSKTCNLLNYTETCAVFSSINADWVIHLAARVGGVNSNKKYIADFYRENILINTNTLEAARKSSAKKLISLLSTCIYPDKITYPMKENKIHDGEPHQSNYGYAFAKRMLDVQSRAYREQYGLNYITAVPNNLFGENDNYHLNDSHVIPAMIHKMFRASQNSEQVILWGDGSPLREFTYSVDIAKILLFLLENYNEPEPINIGNTKEKTIKDVATSIKHLLNYKGKIVWDITKPSGQFRKPSCNKRLIDLGWQEAEYSDFDESLKRSCDWFVNNYPKVRGIK